jgi:hypothetical protein
VLDIRSDVRITFDIKDTWQARCLVAARDWQKPIVLSILAHNFEDALLTLCAVIYPHFDGFLPAPYLTSAARIDKAGMVVAKVMGCDGYEKEEVLYRNEVALRNDFRLLADRLKLNDADRVELFAAVKRWVVADRRLDPTMDPRDPDAKRLH